MVRVKVCGITRLEDGLAAARMGADMLGFIFAPSPRQVTADTARTIIRGLPRHVMTVGVFVNAPVEEMIEARRFCGLGTLQLHGDESEEVVRAVGAPTIKALRIADAELDCTKAFPAATLLLDTYHPHAVGGTGKTFDWRLAVGPARTRQVILAGGLTPDNVIDAIRTVRPYAVDVSSGVEIEPGRKDHAKLECFITRAKSLEIDAR
jgi:phosphoribosylanthranilate isomerase